MKQLTSEPLECDECGRRSLLATYDPATHIVTYSCSMCYLEFYDTNLDFDREEVEP